MEEKSSATSNTYASNGASDINHPVFRPSILNFTPKPFELPGNSTKSESTPVTTTSSTGSSTNSVLSKPSISAPPINITRKDDTVPGGFVFGSNISSRVVNAATSHGASCSLWSAAEADSSASVFTALAKAVTSSKREENDSDEQTLADSAKKVTEDQKQAAVSLAQVDVFTGEEDELQVFRMHCQAYVFDTDKQRWNALGATHFHLNDIPRSADGNAVDGVTKCRSRVVVRLLSTRRVIINSPVWDSMPVALVDSRSLRIGAVSEDGDHLRSYLFKFSPDDSASKICAALNTRKARAAEVKGAEQSYHRLAGQKRSLDASADQTEKNLAPSSTNSSSSGHSSETVAPEPVPNPPVFRPSVLCPSDDSSNLRPSTTPAITGTSAPIGPVLFRQSALDPVVKRLRTDQTGLESQIKSTTEEKCGLSQTLNVVPVPTAAIVNLPTKRTVSSNFVFGQNISDRVTNASAVPPSKELPGMREEDNGEDHETAEITPCPTTLADSASAVAAELRDKPTLPFSEIPKEPIVTGEEGECTALKTYCRFYDFDREKQLWVERGNAYVHLNDIPLPSTGADAPSIGITAVRTPTGPPTRSRLVVRVCKTLKLLANTPIWSGLNVAIADEHSIRLTTIRSVTTEELSAGENQSVENQPKPEFHAYLLVMRSPNDASRLYQALIARKNITIRSGVSCEDLVDTGESTPDSGSVHGSNETATCLAVGTTEAAESGSIQSLN
ncbi:Ran-binding protein 3 [Fasciola hepatica]|uniref:Ran-binding protein 3 n=1 Tax=Fasciola hepatica TaxID=6192 RepID=A0A4E0RU52_FASHE|nr:Ran-binding protein 3 [Fasciola hepatica]